MEFRRQKNHAKWHTTLSNQFALKTGTWILDKVKRLVEWSLQRTYELYKSSSWQEHIDQTTKKFLKQ